MPNSATHPHSAKPRVHRAEGVAVVVYSAMLPDDALFRVLATLKPLDPKEPRIGREERRLRERALDAPPRISVISEGLSLQGAVHVAKESLLRPLSANIHPTTTWVEEML